MRRGPGDHIRAIRITDMIPADPKVASPDTPAIRRYKAQHLREVAYAVEHHVCEYDEPGVCEDCPRMPRGKAGQSIPERIEKARRKRQAEINRPAQPLDNPPPA